MRRASNAEALGHSRTYSISTVSSFHYLAVTAERDRLAQKSLPASTPSPGIRRLKAWLAPQTILRLSAASVVIRHAENAWWHHGTRSMQSTKQQSLSTRSGPLVIPIAQLQVREGNGKSNPLLLLRPCASALGQVEQFNTSQHLTNERKSVACKRRTSPGALSADPHAERL